YEAFHDNLLTELKPVGPVETMLAERFVSLSWRLQRAERMQNQVFEVTIARDEPSPLSKRMHDILPKDLQEIDYDTRAAGPELVLGRSVIRDFANARVLDRLILYERRIENSMLRIMREFKKQQLMRRIEQNDISYDQAIYGTEELTGKSIDLKKQSQLSVDHISANSLKKGDYDKSPDGGDVENKAKQTQIDAVEPNKEAGKREKSLASANRLTG
ncbi:MAG: hypothetical protein ACYS3S_25455, partial [Planctomycetota bacterium]